MSRDDIEAKVIEITGVKLDPNAKYLFLLDNRFISKSEAWRDYGPAIEKLIGRDNFIIASVKGPVDEAMKIYEIPPK